MQPFRQVFLAGTGHVFVGHQQRLGHAVVGAGNRFDRGIGSGLDSNIARAVDDRVELDHAALVGRTHPVIGDDHQIERHAQNRCRVDQLADPDIDFGKGGIDLGTVGAEAMALRIDRIEIDRGEGGADAGGAAQPVDQGVHALHVGDVLIEAQPIGRALAAEGHFAPGPEHGRGAQACPFGGDPDGFGLAPPEGIERLRCIAEAEHHARAARIDHRVADDAVAIRALPRDDGVVVGESLGRKAWPHRRAGALLGQRSKARGDAAFDIVGAETVDPHQHGDRLRTLLGGKAGGKQQGGNKQDQTHRQGLRQESVTGTRQTLNLNSSTSPSCTTYSLPSCRNLPASFAPASPPSAM